MKRRPISRDHSTFEMTRMVAWPPTNRSGFRLPDRPASLAVIGGGPIGLALGQSFFRLGTEVTIFEVMDRIAGTEEPAISLELARLLEGKGLRIIPLGDLC